MNNHAICSFAGQTYRRGRRLDSSLATTYVGQGRPMAGARYNLYEAKTSLSELVDRAAQGEEIIIAKDGKPLAKLISAKQVHRRKPGGWRKGVFISDDFDEPLPTSLQGAFEGKSR